MSKEIEVEFLQKINIHKGILFKVSRMYMDNINDQEDLYQEIVYQLWRSYANFKAESKFSTWMYRVAINTAITFFKKERVRMSAVDAFSSNETARDEFTEDNINTEVDFLYKAIHCLSKLDKALVFFYLEGMSHREIGLNLGITEGNTRVKLNRAKSKLQEIIKKQGYEF